jgi:hypothetical protein
MALLMRPIFCLPGNMQQSTDKILATAVAVLLNVAAAWFLGSEMQRSRYTEHVAVNSALQVVWIRRPSVAKVDRPQPEVARSIKKSADAASSKRRSSRHSQNLAVLDVSTTKTSTAIISVSGDDQWGPANLPAKAMVPAAGQLFLNNPLAHHSGPLEATQNRMNLVFRDGSFGGTLQRISKQQMCGDLRRTLATDSSSAESILRTMKKYDCTR